MTGVDFLPAEYWKRRASQRDQFYLLGIGGALILLLIGVVGQQAHKDALIRAQLAAVEGEYQNVLGQAAEVKRLEERRRPLAFDAKFYSLLRAHPSYSRPLVALATSCPSRVTLKSVSLRRVQIAAPEAPRPGVTRGAPPLASPSMQELRGEQLGRFARDREQARALLRIEGVSATDPDVTELVARLERSECFASVTFTISDNASASPIELRKFTIQCWLAKVL